MVITSLIRFYQRTISPDHGIARMFFPYGYCKFYPSCSEYALQSVRLRGVWKGLICGLLRIMRCHPWSAGGVDFPSQRKNPSPYL